MSFLSRLFGNSAPVQQSRATKPLPTAAALADSRGYRSLQVSMHCNVLNLEDELAAVVPRHRDVLIKKHSELLILDDYGEIDATRWEQEVISYAQRFADFDAHCVVVREELDFQVEIGDIDEHTADQLMEIFATVIPVQTIEGLIGVSEPRPRTDLDREAEALRRSARWQTDQALAKRGLQRSRDEGLGGPPAATGEGSALGNFQHISDGFQEGALSAHMRAYSLERLKAMVADESLSSDARRRALAELGARGNS